MTDLPANEKISNRKKYLQLLKTEAAHWDIIVIGGGATGLGIGLDATARG